MNKATISNQVALIYQTTYSGSIEAIKILLKEKFNAQEKEIVQYPIPSDAPAEIPRVEMRSGNIFIQFSNTRADIVFKDNSYNTDLADKFCSTVMELKVVIGRVGFISKSVLTDVNENFLRRNLRISDEILFPDFVEVSEASWRVNKKWTTKDTPCNNISTITLVKSDDNPALLLERDVNTSQTNNLSLSNTDEIRLFLVNLKQEAENNFGVIE